MTSAPANANLSLSSKQLEHGVILWQWMTNDNGLECPVSSQLRQESIQVRPM
jgi:hypothetical protein